MTSSPPIHRLSDPADPRLVDYRNLSDIRARRRIEGDEFFIAEGPTAIERLVASDHHLRSILLSESRLDRFADLIATVAAPVYVVAPDLLTEIVGFNLHRGAIAAADRQPGRSLHEIADQAQRIAILEGLNDPENLGAIARSAHALHIDALILDPTCIDPYTRRTVRVSMGEILWLDWCRVDSITDALAELHASGWETWALTPAADADNIWTLPIPQRTAVILGAEGPGLTTTTMMTATRRVRLPIHPDVDSLNVGHAAAVSFAVLSRPQR
ncbi:MAG: RNA methyltransferase [Ilumatobacter coccineus]|uniref:RNA methyltransferase n=1 Tax=Ilumatobacter coccineus TaxID=467094 RepID=A0A2G6KA40_9ACTN|nr:MAG: RNA methyltransferase [Ilumatobacter coccineus]